MTRFGLCLDVAGPPEGGTFGTPPKVVKTDHDCTDCGEVHLLEECPDCGSNDIGYGFGLGCGPGFGTYKYCDCGWTWKEALPHDED